MSKLDFERLILVLRIAHVFNTYMLHQDTIWIAIEYSHIFGPNVYVLAFLSICSYAPGSFSLVVDIHVPLDTAVISPCTNPSPPILLTFSV